MKLQRKVGARARGDLESSPVSFHLPFFLLLHDRIVWHYTSFRLTSPPFYTHVNAAETATARTTLKLVCFGLFLFLRKPHHGLLAEFRTSRGRR